MTTMTKWDVLCLCLLVLWASVSNPKLVLKSLQKPWLRVMWTYYRIEYKYSIQVLQIQSWIQCTRILTWNTDLFFYFHTGVVAYRTVSELILQPQLLYLFWNFLCIIHENHSQMKICSVPSYFGLEMWPWNFGWSWIFVDIYLRQIFQVFRYY